MEFKINIHKIFLGLILLFPALAFSQAGPDRVRMLVNSLETDSDYKVRIAAAQALSQIADGSVADWMVRAFRKDDNEAVRLAILYSISEIPDQRILSPLIELAFQEVLSGKERLVLEQIIWNFREIFNTSVWIAEAHNSSDPAIKSVAIWLLGIIGESDMTPILINLAGSSNEDIQVKSLEALSKMGTSAAMEFCRSKLTEPLATHVIRAAKVCEQMNNLSISKKTNQTFRKKMVLMLDGIKKNSFKPSNFSSYLNKNLNGREVDRAIAFLKPTGSVMVSEKTVKLIEQEKIQTFQLVVDLVSKYEFDSRDLEILKSIVRENSNSLDHCYVSELKNNPTLKGEIKTFFKILKSGTLAQIKITESSLKSEPVESCMLTELAQFEFPNLPVEYVNLIYTFSFTPPKATQVRLQ
jgi:hypothetical protein